MRVQKTRILTVNLWPVVSWLLIGQVLASAIVHANSENCWNREDVCVIKADVQQAVPSGSTSPLQVEINCLETTGSNEAGADGLVPIKSAPQLWRATDTKHEVLLNGCHTPPFKNISYGLELLPICAHVTKVTVQHFRGDQLQPLHCFKSPNDVTTTDIQTLDVSKNEIITLAADSLKYLKQLRAVRFFDNSLRHIERTAFDTLPSLQSVQLEKEQLLALKESDLLQHTTLASVHMTSLRHVNAQMFQQLPTTLLNLYVANTPVEGGNVLLINQQQLRNISLISVGLQTFILQDDYTSVKFLNLSGNALVDFRVYLARGNNSKSIGSALEVLDLSENQLKQMQWDWLQPLKQLQLLLLRGNLLKTLSLTHLLSVTPSAHYVDLRANRLVGFSNTLLQQERIVPAARIQIDENPWNCLWLLEFAHSHPQWFRIFQYEKFISQINVNGLACQPAEVTQAPLVVQKNTTDSPQLSNTDPKIQHAGHAPVTSTPLNVSTYTLVYGSPWEYKRNQRAEALIIVFMLPLGIAFLFLLLYMWIHCQRMFHLSYYRSCPLIGLSQSPSVGIMNSAERFDVVRQLPPSSSATMLTSPTSNEDYEMPLDGITPSVCNCASYSAPNGGVGQKCQKPQHHSHHHHHITYVAIPSEQPYKLYEEILGEEEQDGSATLDERPTAVGASAPSREAVYDHLSFEEPGVDADL